jgi:hypothetical protein
VLAAFRAQLVGGEVAFTSDDFCAVKTDHGWLATVRVDDYRRPSWPDPAGHPFCLSSQIPE